MAGHQDDAVRSNIKDLSEPLDPRVANRLDHRVHSPRTQEQDSIGGCPSRQKELRSRAPFLLQGRDTLGSSSGRGSPQAATVTKRSLLRLRLIGAQRRRLVLILLLPSEVLLFATLRNRACGFEDLEGNWLQGLWRKVSNIHSCWLVIIKFAFQDALLYTSNGRPMSVPFTGSSEGELIPSFRVPADRVRASIEHTGSRAVQQSRAALQQLGAPTEMLGVNPSKR